MRNISKFIHEFTEHCTLNGGERSLLLQKVVASAIAYAVPVVIATPGEISDSYHKLVLPTAIKFISEINEHYILNTDLVLSDTKLLWDGRYLLLNDTQYVDNFELFNRSLNVNIDLNTKHKYWTDRLVSIVIGYIEASKLNME